MELSELINTLEGAMEKATKGEMEVEPDLYGYGYGIFIDFIERNPVRCTISDHFETDADAQAIAVRHNTGAMVLECLSDLRTHIHWHEEAIKLQGPGPGRTPSMVNAWVRNTMSSRDSWKRRAKSAEAEVERLHNISKYGRASGKQGPTS